MKRYETGPFKFISARVPESEMDLVKKMAEDEHTSVSELVRHVMFKRAVRLGYTKDSD